MRLFVFNFLEIIRKTPTIEPKIDDINIIRIDLIGSPTASPIRNPSLTSPPPIHRPDDVI